MLTLKQAGLLIYIDTYTRENGGVSPSTDEMRDRLNLSSKSGVARLLDGLEERGMIRRLKGRARSVEVLRLPDDAHRAVKQPVPSIPSSARRLLGLIAIADHIAAQPWCSADVDTVKRSLRTMLNG